MENKKHQLRLCSETKLKPKKESNHAENKDFNMLVGNGLYFGIMQILLRP